MYESKATHEKVHKFCVTIPDTTEGPRTLGGLKMIKLFTKFESPCASEKK